MKRSSPYSNSKNKRLSILQYYKVERDDSSTCLLSQEHYNDLLPSTSHNLMSTPCRNLDNQTISSSTDSQSASDCTDESQELVKSTNSSGNIKSQTLNKTISWPIGYNKGKSSGDVEPVKKGKATEKILVNSSRTNLNDAMRHELSQCPICGKYYTCDIIALHASDCTGESYSAKKSPELLAQSVSHPFSSGNMSRSGQYLNVNNSDCNRELKSNDKLDISITEASDVTVDDSYLADATSQVKDGRSPISTAQRKSNNSKDNLSQSSNNIFSRMMSKAESQRTCKWEFSLMLSDGKLIPAVHIDKVLSSQRSEIVWMKDFNLKNVRKEILLDKNVMESTADGSEVKMKLFTNIFSESIELPPNTITTVVGPDGFNMTTTSPIHVSLLKSMLQKAIRRGMVSEAIHIAVELCKISMGEFLRRIPIICLEDCILHPGFPIFVWLMLAHSKGYGISNYLHHVCITIVGELATCQYKDYPYSSEIFSRLEKEVMTDMNNMHTEETINISDDKDLKPVELNEGSITLIGSILLRACYGGMLCDIDLMLQSARTWKYRLLHKNITGYSIQSSDSYPFHYLHPSYFTSFYSRDILREKSIDGENGSKSIPSSSSIRFVRDISHGVDWLHVLCTVFTKQLSTLSALSVDISDNQRYKELDSLCKYLCHSANCSRCKQSYTPKSMDRDQIESPSEMHNDYSMDCNSFRTSIFNKFPLCSQHLVSHGIDYHCDWQITSYIYRINQEKLLELFQSDDDNQKKYFPELDNFDKYEKDIHSLLEELIKKSIWIFASGTNMRGPWTVDNNSVAIYERLIESSLIEKRKFAPIWAIIAPSRKFYINSKLEYLAKHISKST